MYNTGLQNEDEIVKVFLDINPTTNGDSLIVPKKHYKDFREVPNETLNHINDTKGINSANEKVLSWKFYNRASRDKTVVSWAFTPVLWLQDRWM